MQQNAEQTKPQTPVSQEEVETAPAPSAAQLAKVKELGGQAGPEPTRYGDWEKGGRCTDF